MKESVRLVTYSPSCTCNEFHHIEIPCVSVSLYTRQYKILGTFLNPNKFKCFLKETEVIIQTTGSATSSHHIIITTMFMEILFEFIIYMTLHV